MLSTLQGVIYQVAYVPQAGSADNFSSLWIVIPAALAIILVIRRPPIRRALFYLAFAVVATFAMVSALRSWNRGVSRQYDMASRAARDPTTPVVEGRVEGFQPAPAEGHQDETFTVGGVRFAYSDYVITGGFNQTQSHGGPIHEGVAVRIHYIPGPNVIVKLEIAN
jgi:hypothetical protein